MADTEETANQRQARLRREKREKKLREGGSARLEKISGLSGRSYEATAPTNPASGTATPDPPEADISSVTPAPLRSQAQPTQAGGEDAAAAQAQMQAQLRALLNEPSPAAGAGGPNPAGPAPDADPMMQMLQQMLAGGAGGPGAAPDTSGLPPALASLLGGGPPGAAPGAPPAPPPRSTYAWRIAHALASLVLAAYVLWAHPFTGSQAARQAFLLGDTPTANVFWLFATVELALQSSRFLLANKAVEVPGMVGMVAGMLPPPWGGRIRLASRYVGILGTLVGDAMVLVFVLGVAAWWQGVTA